MKKKISKKIVGAMAIAIAFTGISIHTIAAEDYTDFTSLNIQSYGTFTYDDGDTANDNGHDHDLYIDTTDLANLSIAVEELQQAFRDGVNKIYNKLVGLGFTPKSKSPVDINEAIQNVYDNRYKEGNTEGYNNGYKEGNTNGYNEGHTAGYNEGYAAGGAPSNVFSNENIVKKYWYPAYQGAYAIRDTIGYISGYPSSTVDISRNRTETVTSPTAKEIFGPGYVLLGCEYRNSEATNSYTTVYSSGCTNLFKENGTVSITYSTVSSSDATNSVYEYFIIYAYKVP